MKHAASEPQVKLANGTAAVSPPAPCCGTEARLRRILVPVDFSPCAHQALGYALSLAEQVGATVILLHVVEPAMHHGSPSLLAAPALDPANQNLLEEGRERLAALYQKLGQKSKVECLVRMGHAYSEIADTAKALAADLIVICAHGDSYPRSALLGSTAERVLRHAPCPVMTLRRAG